MARILVMDDDAGVRVAVKAILEGNRHTVVLTECGSRGLAATEIYAFDVVIADIFMPGMDGLESIKLLCRDEPAVKVIAISGYAFRAGSIAAPDFLQMAIKLGAAGCLHKPFTAHELIETIEAQCPRGRQARTAAEIARDDKVPGTQTGHLAAAAS